MAVAAYQIGDFRLDCGRFELLRNNRNVKLERKPLELLILFVECRDRLITREEIAKRLWPSDIFVEVDHGINTAIRKLRHALRDDPENPRFIETVTGKGYRFIAPVVAVSVPVPPSAASPEPPALPQPSAPSRYPQIVPGIAGIAALLLVVVLTSRSVRARIFRPSPGPDITSLAVLPLTNFSGDPSQEYFADGMTDELITMLAKDSNLRITSRTSVIQFKGTRQRLPEIARALDVQAILEGSVTRSNDRVHLTLQLVRADTDTHLWAESYDRDASEAANLPNMASQAVARYLHSYIATAPPPRPVNPEAHDAYLHGRYLWWGEQKDRGLADFKRAIEIQPDYAMGWAGLASYYGGGIISGTLDPKEGMAPDLEAATRAVQLDDSQPEEHLELCAAIFAVQWDFVRADKECLRAIQLDPTYAEAYHFRAKILGAWNHHQEAIESQKKAAELDPVARPWALGATYVVARRFDDAIYYALQRLDSSPRDASLYDVLAAAYAGKGMEKESEEAYEMMAKTGGEPQFAASLHRLYQRDGSRGVLQWKLHNLEDRRRNENIPPIEYIPPLRIAVLYARLGNREKALQLLDEAFREHSPLLLWIQSDPAFDSLHSEPRYRSLIQRIGLPPAW